ncbi:MAG: SRPBCC family protein [Dermatophilaceae bacterium]|nr:SRPBCC family protein [Intrasporangiaceae bacterium]
MGEVRADSTVRIQQSAEQVLAVLRDISAQSQWWPGQYRSEPLETDEDGRVTRALIGNDVKVAKDEFEVLYSHEPGTSGYGWVLAAPSKVQRAQEGSWRVTENGPDACEVTLSLMVDSTLPLPGFLIRKTIQDTVNGATRGLRSRCTR